MDRLCIAGNVAVIESGCTSHNFGQHLRHPTTPKLCTKDGASGPAKKGTLPSPALILASASAHFRQRMNHITLRRGSEAPLIAAMAISRPNKQTHILMARPRYASNVQINFTEDF